MGQAGGVDPGVGQGVTGEAMSWGSLLTLQHLGVFSIGVAVGFLGGLFGKGGSSIATPLLSLVGVPGFVAVAAPLPATVPGTFIASWAYWRSKLLDWQIVFWSLVIGVPATLLGAYLTRYTGAQPLLALTGVLVLGFGLSFTLRPGARVEAPPEGADMVATVRPPFWPLRLFAVAAGVGLVSGLLANSGGFLLAPSYARILRQPLKRAFACSLAVSMVLAVPGTITHAYLGHIDWGIAAVLALGSVPFAYLGARVAIRADARSLERGYGVVLTLLGAFFLFKVF